MKPKKDINTKSLGVRTRDTVVVLSGASKGVQGKVIGVKVAENKVLVEGVNVQKDRQKPRGGGRQSGINEGGIIEKATPIHRSKVALLDPKSGKPTRIKFKTENGQRVRVAVKSGESV
jgi:large subunit ribosomal protein L24